MLLTAYMLNVEHGDSLVISLRDDQRVAWVVIDCNARLDGAVLKVPAADLLNDAGVTEIDLLVITHLHLDHYFGVERILDDFAVKKVAVPPVLTTKGKLFEDFFASFRRKIDAAKDRSSDRQIGHKLLSLSRLLRFLWTNPGLVEEVDGPESVLRIPGWAGPQFTAHLPLKKLRGVVKQIILNGDFDLDNFPKMNDISIALTIEVHGIRILFAGDSTQPQWREHERRAKRDGVGPLGSHVAKLAHHGSVDNNKKRVLDYVGPNVGVALVSANGRSHPHAQVLSLLKDSGVGIYCTNLATTCGAFAVRQPLGAASLVPPGAQSFLQNYSGYDQTLPCQGSVTLEVDQQGSRLFNSTGAPCVYTPTQLRRRRPAPGF